MSSMALWPEVTLGTLRAPSGCLSGLWALPRPTTAHWGSGILLDRIEQTFGKVDICFGKQDNVNGHMAVDVDASVRPGVVADWAAMPFRSGEWEAGFWDPPYLGYIGGQGDVHYSRMDACLSEICRVLSRRLLLLSPLVYPCPDGWRRRATIGITYGPNKVIRCLQVFERPA